MSNYQYADLSNYKVFPEQLENRLKVNFDQRPIGTAFQPGPDPSAPMEGASSISPSRYLQDAMGTIEPENANSALQSYILQSQKRSTQYPNLNKYEEGVIHSTPPSVISANLKEFNDFTGGAYMNDPRFDYPGSDQGNVFTDQGRESYYGKPLTEDNIATNNLDVDPVQSVDNPDENKSLDTDIDANSTLNSGKSQAFELPAEQQRKPGYFSPERRQERQQERETNRMDRQIGREERRMDRQTERDFRAQERANEDALRKQERENRSVERDADREERQKKREERREFRNRPFIVQPSPEKARNEDPNLDKQTVTGEPTLNDKELDMTGYTPSGFTTPPGGSSYGWQSSVPSANDERVATAKRVAEQKQNEEGGCPKGYKLDKETGQCVATNTGMYRERNAGIALNALKYFAEKAGMDEKRKAEVNQRKSFLPDVYMAGAVKGIDRGSEDVNTAMRPGWGVYGTTYEPRYELLGKFGGSRGSNIQYLTDAEIAKIISMGGEVEFLD